jgi:hypothetical protein
VGCPASGASSRSPATTLDLPASDRPPCRPQILETVSCRQGRTPATNGRTSHSARRAP